MALTDQNIDEMKLPFATASSWPTATVIHFACQQPLY
jgi:hypothetical protein